MAAHKEFGQTNLIERFFSTKKYSILLGLNCTHQNQLNININFHFLTFFYLSRGKYYIDNIS